jgi:hypothetical protein
LEQSLDALLFVLFLTLDESLHAFFLVLLLALEKPLDVFLLLTLALEQGLGEHARHDRVSDLALKAENRVLESLRRLNLLRPCVPALPKDGPLRGIPCLICHARPSLRV